MSIEASVPESETVVPAAEAPPEPPPPENVKPYQRKRRGFVYDAKLKVWRPEKRRGRPPLRRSGVSDAFAEINIDLTPTIERDADGEQSYLLRRPNRELKTFDDSDDRERLRSKSMEASELVLDEIRERLASAEKVARIPTTVLVRTLKYLDERNVEIARRMKEEGLESTAPVESHKHLTLFQFDPNVYAALPKEAQELIEAQRLRATEQNGG